MVSAVLIAIVAVGVFAGLDAAGNSSGNTKSRGVAASIAQEDQERLRGLQIRDLANRDNELRTVTIGGVAYAVRTTVRAVSDRGAGTDVGCTSSDSGIDYFRVSTAVSWAGLRSRDPVVADTLIAPRAGSFGPDEGGLVVEVSDRNGQPGTGHSVSIAGPTTGTDQTDAAGCAFFPYVPKGSYSMTLSSGGFVTPAGTQNVVQSVSVPDGAISTVAVNYDRAGSVQANVRTWNGVSLVVDAGRSIVVGNSGVPAPGWRSFPNGGPGSPAASIATSQTLYPFTSPYAVYAGSCSGANPASFGGAVSSALVAPAGNQVVTVEEPTLGVRVLRWDGRAWVSAVGAGVWVEDQTCGGARFSPGATVSTGRLSAPGLPYGTYKVCAEWSYSGAWRHSDPNEPASLKANTTRSGVPAYNLQIGSAVKLPDSGQPSTRDGQCPR